MRRRAALLACCLLLAGCSGQPATPSPTLSPVPVERPGTAASPAGPLPGLGAEGVRDPSALAGRHRAALADASFTRVVTERIRRDDRTLWRSWSRTSVDRNRSRYSYRRNATGTAAYPLGPFRRHVESYYDGNASYFRTTRDGSARYRRVTGTTATLLGEATNHDRLVGLYDAFRFRVAAHADGYRLAGVQRETIVRGTTPVETVYVGGELRETDLGAFVNAPPLVTDPRDARLTVWLAPDGRVTAYRLSFAGTLDGRPVRVTRTVDFTAVGNTTVTRPAWYGEAVAATA